MGYKTIINSLYKLFLKIITLEQGPLEQIKDALNKNLEALCVILRRNYHFFGLTANAT